MFSTNFAEVNFSIIDIYKDYVKEVPAKIQVSKDIFKKINKKYAEKAVHEILYNSESVKFPIIGAFRIKKFKQDFTKPQRIDHKRSKELGCTVYFLNEERDGYAYKWQWDKNYRLLNSRYYSYLPAKYTVRRQLPKVLKNNPQIDFFE